MDPETTYPSSPPPRRAIRTYGRPKAVAADNDADAFFSTAGISETSMTHTTRAQTLPSSPLSDAADSEDIFAAKPGQAASGTSWGWKAKLDAIDNDDDDFDSSQVYVADPASKLEDKSATPPLQSNALLPSHSTTIPTLRHPTSQSPARTESPEPSSPSPIKAGPRRRKPSRVHDSDSESTPKSKSGSSASSQKCRPTLDDDSDEDIPDASTLALPTIRAAVKDSVTHPVHSDEQEESVVPKQARAGSKRSRVTKKDMHETSKARVRIANEQAVGLVPTSQAKFTTSKLLLKLQPPANMPPPLKQELSDVIEQFSSPALRPNQKTVHVVKRPTPVATRRDIPDLNNDSDDDLPESVTIKSSAAPPPTKATLLKKYKEEQLAKKTSVAPPDDDDDLEILPEQESKPVVSRIGPNLSAQRNAPRKSIPVQLAKAKPTVNGLNSQLLNRIEDVNEQHRKEREQEYVKGGGKVVQPVQGAPATSIDEYYKRRQAVEAKGHMVELPASDAEDEDEDDEDYNPALRGSASPEPDVDAGQSDSEMDGDPDRTMVNSSPTKLVMAEPMDTLSEAETVEEHEDKENEVKPFRRGFKQAKAAIIHSDDETENEDENENVPPMPRLTSQRSFGQILASDSSAPDPVNDENADPQPGFSIHLDPRSPSSVSMDSLLNNENESPFPAFDIHANPSLPSKTGIETTPLAAMRPALNHRPDSIGGLAAGVQGRLALSPRDDDFDMEDVVHPRAPALSALGTRSLSFTQMLERSSPSSTPGPSRASQATLQPSPLQPQFGLSKGDSFGFSQFSPSQKGKGQGLFNRKAPLEDDLLLTQDFGLKPAHKVSETQRERADEVFEKAQGYVLQEAQREQPQKKDTLYVNDLGFLTQTRPNEDAEVYCASQAPAPLTPAFSMSGRMPFAPLSVASSTASPDIFSDEEEDEDGEVAPTRGRLSHTRPERRANSPSDGREALVPSQKPSTSTTKPKSPRQKRALEPSNLVHDQAVESDEDEIGFGGPGRNEDDEEEGQDLDAPLLELLDDKEMSESELNKDLVMEKVQQDLAAADEANEARVRAAATGEWRHKRRHGVGIDSDGSEDEDGAPRHLKKRKKERTDIAHLAEKAETKSFAETYQSAIQIEPLSFPDPAADGDVQMRQVVYDSDEDEERDEENTISVQDVKAQLREAAQQGVQMPEMDVHDVSWIEDEANSDEDTPAVRYTATNVSVPTVSKEEFDELQLQRNNNKAKAAIDDRQKKWAKHEGHRHHLNTGKSGTGSAITGHGKRTAANGKASKEATNATRPKAPLKAAASVLSGVDRSGRFS